ncbi:MAG: M23 family metallopeptidase [Burkholderiaceae bacterium]|nr:M23 family metallopeptidase [Burkholderiaceae bacterium]
MVRDNGRRPHHGWDLRAMTGTPCYATAGGRVVSIRDRTGYGLTLDIHLDHMIDGGPVYLRLAHLSRVADGMETGTRVSQGQLVCYTGNSGASNGAHLHFEYMKRSEPSPGELGIKHRYNPAKVYGDATPGQTYCEPCTGG